MRFCTPCCIAFLALVARSNSSTANATRTDVGGSAEAVAAAEGRLVFIGNTSYVRGWSGVGGLELPGSVG